MNGFIMGFCCGMGWIVLVFCIWAIRASFSTGLDLGG